jgi:hypothetical protein
MPEYRPANSKIGMRTTIVPVIPVEIEGVIFQERSDFEVVEFIVFLICNVLIPFQSFSQALSSTSSMI